MRWIGKGKGKGKVGTYRSDDIDIEKSVGMKRDPNATNNCRAFGFSNKLKEPCQSGTQDAC